MDGVLWLGGAPAGAAFLARLRPHSRTIPFWTTPIGGDPVFFHLLSEHLDEETLGPVFWGIAFDGSISQELYLDWAAAHRTASPTSFAVYVATQHALEQIDGTARPSVAPNLAIFKLDSEGSSHLVEFVPFP